MIHSTASRRRIVTTLAAGRPSGTFSRGNVDAVASCYGGPVPTAGTPVTVIGATSDIQTPYENVLSGGVVVRDSAGAGPSVTLAN